MEVGRQRRGMGAVDLEVMAMSILVMMVQHTLELRSSHPLHGVVDRINENGGPYIGLLMTFPTEEFALEASGLFLPCTENPFVDLAGITVQILLDAFDIKGVVHYGIAGSANDSLQVGDVSVPQYVAYTGSWKWTEFKSGEKQLTELKFGEYNFPEEGENLLAKVEFTPEQLYSIGKPMEEVFWLPVEPTWFSIATQLKDVKLKQCLNETYCLPEMPKVVYGLRGSTADVYLNNAAFRKFLFSNFNVSTVDEESSAVIMTSISNGVPCVVFRGVSDMAGGGKLSSLSLTSLAAINALSVAVEFIQLIDKQTLLHDQ